jgi:hypothetical protein
MKLESSRQVYKNSQIFNFVKILPVGVELFLSENVMYITYKICSTEELSLEITARMRTVKWLVEKSYSGVHVPCVTKL